MHIRLNRAAFADAAAWVAGAISRNPATPALAGMYLDASADNGSADVILSGFDLDTLHEALVPATVVKSGKALVSGRFLVSIVAAMKGETVDLQIDGPMLTVSAGRSKYRMQTMPLSEWPNVPEFPKHVGSIAGETLAAMLGTVEHAVDKTGTVPAMTAFNIVGTAGALTIQATDRFRIARATAKWADASGEDFTANVPAPALATAVKGMDGDLEVGCHGGSFGLTNGSRSVTTRLLGEEHKYPPIDRVFDTAPLVNIEADTPPIVEALKRAILVSDDRALVMVTFSDGLLTISADGKVSEGVEEIDVAPGFGEGDMTLKFNAAFLSQALAASPTERVRFGLIAPGRQVLIEPIGDDTSAFIVMPRGSAE